MKPKKKKGIDYNENTAIWNILNPNYGIIDRMQKLTMWWSARCPSSLTSEDNESLKSQHSFLSLYIYIYIYI